MPEAFSELLAQGRQELLDGQQAESRATFLKVVRSASVAGDREALAAALSGLAEAEHVIGNLGAAQHHDASAAVLYRQLGDLQALAGTLRQEADVLGEAGKSDDARRLYREAESIYRQQGEVNMVDLADTLRLLAMTYETPASSNEGKRLWREARDLYAKLGIEERVAECERFLSQSNQDI